MPKRALTSLPVKKGNPLVKYKPKYVNPKFRHPTARVRFVDLFLRPVFHPFLIQMRQVGICVISVVRRTSRVEQKA